MLFYTPEFLVFSILLLTALAIVHRDTPRKIVLLAASYLFYMWWNPAFVGLILFSTAVDYTVGRRMAVVDDGGRRRALLVVSLAANLGLLGFFKYQGLFSESLLYGMRQLGFEAHWSTLHVVLPVGISFYTFQTLSYSIDVYRRTIPATRRPLDFALFVAFFPQLVAGPIVRAREFLPQLERPVRPAFRQDAFFRVLRGLAKKVLIADNLAALPDAVFQDPAAWPSLVIWAATICFAIQIYCDFSGYSDIAIGIARILGFELPENFDHPYFSRNPREFWRRWHITLSSWLRDYLYIPLGGNRSGAVRTGLSLMITMLLGGLWHGASWNFVVWGALHGILLVGHRTWSALRPDAKGGAAPGGVLGRLLSVVAMQYCVLLTWIAFRVRDFDHMAVAMRKFVLFDFDLSLSGIGLGRLSFFSTLALAAVFAVLHVTGALAGSLDIRLSRAPLPVAVLACIVLGLAAFLLWPLEEAPFIYFQF